LNAKKNINFETYRIETATNWQKTRKFLRNKEMKNQENQTMNPNCYIRPAWTHNGSIRTDLPLTILPKTNRQKLIEMLLPGQLLCVGEVYIKTHKGLVRIR
jgi:hypothetical protein